MNSIGQIEITGWTRTFILALGGMAGVLITAGLIHVYKGGMGKGRRMAGRSVHGLELKLVKRRLPQVR